MSTNKRTSLFSSYKKRKTIKLNKKVLVMF